MSCAKCVRKGYERENFLAEIRELEEDKRELARLRSLVQRYRVVSDLNDCIDDKDLDIQGLREDIEAV